MVRVAIPQGIHGGLGRAVLRDIVESVKQRRYQAHTRDILQRILDARQSGPVAAHLGAQPGQGEGDTVAGIALIQSLGAGVARSRAILKEIGHRATQQLGIEPVVHANGQVGGNAQAVRGLQDEEGEGTGQVAAIGRGAADLGIVGVVHDQAGDVPDHGLVILEPRSAVGLVEGAKELIDLARSAAAPIHLVQALEPGEELAGLAQGTGRVLHQPVVHLGDGEEVGRQHGVGFLGGHGAGQGHVAADEGLDAEDQVLFAIVEGGVDGAIEGAVKPDLVQKAAPAQLQADGHVGAEVAHGADAGGDDIVLEEERLEVRGLILGAPAAHAWDAARDPGASE